MIVVLVVAAVVSFAAKCTTCVDNVCKESAVLLCCGNQGCASSNAFA